MSRGAQYDRRMEGPETSPGPASRAGAAAFVAAGASLAAEHALAELLAALRAAGADPIAIKGPVQARWLYGTPRRPSIDLDLLVAPEDVPPAAAALRRLGYRPYLDPGDGTGTGYAQTWHKDGGVPVDLHWSLAGADPERLWPALRRATELTPVGSETARIPTVPGRALVLALHAAQHGSEEPHVLDDLARALEIVDGNGWREAAALARQAGAAAAFAAGLRTLPEGQAVARALVLTEASTPELELRRAGEPPHRARLRAPGRDTRRRSESEAPRPRARPTGVLHARLAPRRKPRPRRPRARLPLPPALARMVGALRLPRLAPREEGRPGVAAPGAVRLTARIR